MCVIMFLGVIEMVSDERKQIMKRYRAINADKIREQRHKYYLEHQEEIKQKRKQYYLENKDKMDTASRVRCKEWRRQERRAVIEAYGGKCEICGESFYPFLTIDHSFKDGAQKRAEFGRRASCTRTTHDLMKRGFPKNEGIRILCFNCNCSRLSDEELNKHYAPKSAEE